MNILNATKNLVVDFAREEEGAQVVEYALVIALVSIALALALSSAFTGTGGPFGTFVNNVKNCLGNTSATAKC